MGVLVLAAGVLHTRWVRSAVLSWALARAGADAGIRAEVGRLDYNLFTLSGSLHDVTLAAIGSATPFFHAEAIHIDLPWSVVRRAVAIDSLEIRQPRLAIVRHADGTSNLPRGTDDGGDPSIGRIHLGRLVVTGLEARYDDRALDLTVHGRGVNLHMDDGAGLLKGRLASPANLVVRVGTRQTRISRLEGELTFDGSMLTLGELALQSPEGALQVSGGIDLLTDGRLHELHYAGHVAMEQASPWASIEPPAGGRLAFAGDIEGTLDRPDATLQLAGDRLAWSGLDASLTSNARLSADGAEITSFTVALAGGEIAGDARIPFVDDGEGQAQLRWRNIEAPRLAAVPGAPALTRVASSASGTAALYWTGRRILDGRGSLENVLRPHPRRGALALGGRVDVRLDAGAYRLTHEHHVSGGAVLKGRARGRLDPDRLAASTLTGHTALRIDDLAVAVRQARDAGLLSRAQNVPPLSGVLAAEAELGGTFQAPVARGTLEALQLQVGSLPTGDARAQVVASTDSIAVDDLLVNVGPNTMTGRGTLMPGANTMRGATICEKSFTPKGVRATRYSPSFTSRGRPIRIRRRARGRGR